MKIGVISDTHGDTTAWQKAWEAFGPEVELVIHAGDVLYHGPRNPLPGGYGPGNLAELLNACPVPVVAARGNCDAPIDEELLNFPLQAPLAFCRWEGLGIIVHHGHQAQPAPEQVARRLGASVVISGHTHIPGLEVRNEILFLNPGSPSLPKGEKPGPTVAWLADGEAAVFNLERGEVILRRSWPLTSR
ncbi:MAG: phosphodiesterase [Clostridia bacterium]|nr:MAG: phosphodiesterase [Clostridia bacterium]